MLSGTLDPGALETFAFPTLREARDVTIVQAVWELSGVSGQSLLPPAVHPTMPLLMSVLAFDGVAQVRLSCRHGARARALVIAAREGVTFDGEVLHAGTALIRLHEPTRPLGPGDVQYVASLWPVEIPDRGLRLVQQEVEVEVASLERRSATVESWPVAWPAPATLVGVSVARGDVHLPAPRFMARADVWAFEGSEKV